MDYTLVIEKYPKLRYKFSIKISYIPVDPLVLLALPRYGEQQLLRLDLDSLDYCSRASPRLILPSDRF